MRRAAFLDRDGTINVEVNYLHRAEDLQLITGVPEAIARLNRAGWFVVVVTNQAGIARGYYTIEQMHALHDHIAAVLAQHGAHVDAWMFCPHHPEFSGVCDCRKPAPGMLLDAAHRFEIDLARSWLIGDSAGDLGAGAEAGCRTVLVRTGYGPIVEAMIADGEVTPPFAVADALPQAVEVVFHAEDEQ